MSTRDPRPPDGTIEECVDELDELIGTLERYPAPVLAFALRVHLAGLLRALLEHDLCSREQIGEFARDLEREAVQPNDS